MAAVKKCHHHLVVTSSLVDNSADVIHNLIKNYNFVFNMDVITLSYKEKSRAGKVKLSQLHI